MMPPKLYGLITSRRDEGAFGVLFDALGKEFAVFLMRTFGVENSIVVGPGTYKCPKDFYQHGGYPTFGIPVPGHSRILFHKLNFEEESQGCIGIGESFEIIDGKYGIAQSGKGFTEFWDKYKSWAEIEFILKEFKDPWEKL